MNAFRLLRADEIDCRVSQINQNGLSLLLYKDARCDMNILDETVGPFNWQRYHSRENANCVVSLYDEQKNDWVSKEDTGTESNTEAQKGLASDSFKRACFNWGIGRELYTAPFIWISSDKCNIKEGKNGKLVCNDGFYVEKIVYNDKQEISGLAIRNAKTRKRVYAWSSGAEVVTPTEEAKSQQAAAEQPQTSDIFVPSCADCHVNISDAEHDYSIKRYGRPLCRSCQKKA